MADDNVVPLFGRKKPEPVKSDTPAEKPSSLRSFVRASADSSWAGKFRVETPDGQQSEQDIDMAGFAAVLGTFDLQPVLNKLVQRHEGKIRQYKSVVESYDDEQLQAWLADPKDSDLQRKPYFFHALIDEAKRRFLSGKSSEQKQEPDNENPNPE